MMTTPTTIAVSSQNWNGKSWTSRSVAGSNRYDPAGKKTPWKSSKSWSKATSPTTPTTTTPIVSPMRAAADRAPRAGPVARRLAATRIDDRDRGEDPQPAEDRPHVAPCGACSRSLRTGVPSICDVEVAADDEVRQDRVGGGPKLFGREAVQRRRVRSRPARRRPTAGVRNGRIASATMTIAVARPMRIDAARPPRRSRAHPSPSGAGGRRTRTLGAYSSSSVFAWSHQPSSVRSLGGSTLELVRRAAARARGTRRARGRGCPGAPRCRAWIIS